MGAQAAVDRPEGDPLPPYEPTYDPEPPTDRVSHALGVALGRFGPNGEGILDPDTANLDHALPHAILFLDGTLPGADPRDGLGHPAAAPLHRAWADYGPLIEPKADLRTWLRTKFFGDVHRQMYEGRPIHWPLSSAKKSFVAWINIHRWTPGTLRVLLADHLHPALTRVEGEISDLEPLRFGADRKAARQAERRFTLLAKAREELQTFIAEVTACDSAGPPPTGPKCPAREVDARYAPDLDDGVMINSAALWPLLFPQWKKPDLKNPRRWWTELATAKGRKDYDWSHLAARYFPERVAEECAQDPSLGVAHGCFWRLHPAKAWQWELRLQQEIGPDFRIDEAEADAHRAAYLAEQPAAALAIVEKEIARRRRKLKAEAPDHIQLLEPGLWRALPAEVFAAELAVMAKTKADFRILAPDEAEARAAYLADHPQAMAKRRALLQTQLGLS